MGKLLDNQTDMNYAEGSMKPRIISLIAEIEEFKGYWSGLQILSPERLSALQVLATIESIGSSTRIEGSLLSDSQVSALLKGLDIHSFRSRDDQEVAGYAEAMTQIHESFAEINISENNIKYLHKVLMQFSEKDQWHLGEYKKNSNHVAAYDTNGKQIGVIFETASPFDTPRMMEELITRMFKQLSEETHPLLVISDFALRFLAIHPFQDGNGRLSRVLTNLMLLQHGYQFVMYSSHERIIEANKEEYYQTLRTSQKSLDHSNMLQEAWTEFFLNLLKKQKDELQAKIQLERTILGTPALSGRILDLAREHGRITVSFLVAALDANRNTIKKHLQALVKKGQLNKHGQGRGTYYTRK